MRDEDYIDGIKLPTENTVMQWEKIINSPMGYMELYRVKLNNGYLYYIYQSLYFVPDTSLEVNYAFSQDYEQGKQDSLREFEKEKIKPLEEYVILTEKLSTGLEEKEI